MPKTNPQNIEHAEAAGAAAARRGDNCVPAHCAEYRGLIEGFRIGDGAAHLALCWMNGYRKERMATADAPVLSIGLLVPQAAAPPA